MIAGLPEDLPFEHDASALTLQAPPPPPPAKKPAAAKPPKRPAAPRPTAKPKPSAARPTAAPKPPAATRGPAVNGLPAVLGSDGKYHYHTAAWWLKNWQKVRSLTRCMNPSLSRTRKTSSTPSNPESRCSSSPENVVLRRPMQAASIAAGAAPWGQYHA